MLNNHVIQGLWIGSTLPVMQRVSIQSFVTNGHEFHLYTYSEFADLPKGAILKDANEIIPYAEIFRNVKENTYAAFSDFFRYRLLLIKGGWWADVDFICLRPFDFDDDYVFSSELDLCRERINSGIIKAPAGSALMQYAWETCCQKDKQSLSWDEVGPDLMEEAVQRFSLHQHVKPARSFCPLPSDLWRRVFEPRHRFVFHSDTYAVHLWHELWRREGWNVGASYAPDCLYEQFKSYFVKGEPLTSCVAFKTM